MSGVERTGLTDKDIPGSICTTTYYYYYYYYTPLDSLTRRIQTASSPYSSLAMDKLTQEKNVQKKLKL